MPSATLSEREAVKQLLQTSLACDGTEASTTMRPYDRGLISIPSGGQNAVSIDEWGEVVETTGGFTPYMDETLRKDPLQYCLFVKDLMNSGMVAFHLLWHWARDRRGVSLLGQEG